MISVFVGENDFEAARAVERLASDFDGSVEHIDGAELDLRDLPDLLMGATLFSDKRMVVIKRLSENNSVWSRLPDWIPRVADDVHLVLIEHKPDKRTKTYKNLQKSATFTTFDEWSERDTGKAQQWVKNEAVQRNISLDAKSINTLVNRVGVNQWELHQALEKLAVMDTITPELIHDVVEANPVENVFQLFDAALTGNVAKVHDMVKTLELTEDSYRVLALLSSQVYQLAVLALDEDNSARTMRDLKLPHFVITKLQPHVKKLGRSGIKNIVVLLADADHAMKSTGDDKWLIIETALLQIAAKMRQ